jgi:hypothetical protein
MEDPVSQGQVIGIYIAPVSEAPLQRVDSVRAVSGMGLEGDRYFNRIGSFPKTDPVKALGQQATLIESEALEAIDHESDLCLESGNSRRNIVTRGVALNHLVGKEFRVGDVIMRGIRLCEPCGHLEKLTIPGVRAALLHRGGLRAQILSDGVIHTGDHIECVERARTSV